MVDVVEMNGDELKRTGSVAFKKEDFGAAQACYEKAIAVTAPGNAELLATLNSNISACFLAMNRPKDALQAANVALEHNPEHGKSLYRRAKSLEACGNNVQAYKTLRQAVTLDPGNKLLVNMKEKSLKKSKTFFMNRNRHLKRILESNGWCEAIRGGPQNHGDEAEFAYWDTYGGKPHVHCRVNVWPRDCTNVLDLLWPFYKRCFAEHDAGTTKLKECVLPHTILEGWRDLTEEQFNEGKPWFLKDIFGTGGKGITVVGDYAAYKKEAVGRAHYGSTIEGPAGEERYPDRYIMQRSLRNMLCLAGGVADSSVEGWRVADPLKEPALKQGLRAYFLICGDGRFYVYNDALIYVHTIPYHPDSDSFAVQTSQRVPGSATDDRKVFTLSKWDELYQKVWPGVIAGTRALAPVMQTVIEQFHTRVEPHKRMEGKQDDWPKLRYHLWGVDFMVLDDYSSRFLEMNAYPNLSHHRECEAEFHEGMDRAMMPILGYDEDFVRMDGFAADGTPESWFQITGKIKQPWEKDVGGEPEPMDTLTRGFSDMLGRTTSADATYPGQVDVED